MVDRAAVTIRHGCPEFRSVRGEAQSRLIVRFDQPGAPTKPFEFAK
jgi:hypothetical protein